MDGVLIEVRVNEYAMRRANPHVPWSPAEIGADAAACAEAGVAIVHFHARDSDTGAPSTAIDTYAETMRRVRDVCDVLLMPTLGANTLPDPADRVSHIVALAADAATRPELAPVDFGSFNLGVFDPETRTFRGEHLVYDNPVAAVRYLVETIRGCGVTPMAALWSVGSARLLAALIDAGDLVAPVYAQVTLSETLLSTHPGTVAGMRALLDFLPDRTTRVEWSVLSVGGNLLPLVAPAVEAGGHIAIGLGDYPYPELGTPTNADLVRQVVGELEVLGRRPATAAEVRSSLELGALR